MNNKKTYTNILEQINSLPEYQKKSLAVLLIQYTLNERQVCENNTLYFKHKN